MRENWPCILIAAAGGVTLSLGMLATQYGWAFVGLSVTEVMASSLKVVIGNDHGVLGSKCWESQG